MSITDKIIYYNETLPSNVKLVAVSKFKPNEAIEEAYRAGQRIFGESRPQELQTKVSSLPGDIEWHFIGHLQTNKLKMVVPYAELIHSVDSIKLLEAIDRYARTIEKIQRVLIEIHIAQEESKQGFTPDEAIELISNATQWPNVKIEGLMTMATFTDDVSQIEREFSLAERTLKRTGLSILSMGMSDDYKIALKHNTSYVRIGSDIFGAR
jgi:pyridoxal phosphate enzyme (YggS family)